MRGFGLKRLIAIGRLLYQAYLVANAPTLASAAYGEVGGVGNTSFGNGGVGGRDSGFGGYLAGNNSLTMWSNPSSAVYPSLSYQNSTQMISPLSNLPSSYFFGPSHERVIDLHLQHAQSDPTTISLLSSDAQDELYGAVHSSYVTHHLRGSYPYWPDVLAANDKYNE